MSRFGYSFSLICVINRKDKKRLFSPVTYVQLFPLCASGTSAQLLEMIPGGLKELRSDTLAGEMFHVLQGKRRIRGSREMFSPSWGCPAAWKVKS